MTGLADLDPEAAALLPFIEAAVPVFDETLTVAALRARLHGPPSASPHQMAAIIDETAPGPLGPIPIRLFRPSKAECLPVLIWFQGGGLVTGTLDTADAICRDLAQSSGCLVVSVAHRLAPEHPFPAPIEDASAAVQHVIAKARSWGADPARIAVGGESAGATVAMLCVYIARDRSLEIPAAALLVSPTADRRLDTPSAIAFADGPVLTGAGMRWFTEQVHPGGAGLDHPLADLASQRDHRGLPPTLILTMALDPTRDATETYARVLIEAGTLITAQRIAGLFHGSFTLPISRAARMRADALRWLRAQLDG